MGFLALTSWLVALGFAFRFIRTALRIGRLLRCLETEVKTFQDPAMTEVVCGVIVDDEGSILACRRSPERVLGGLWEFPGGKVDEGESYEQALRRELMEELGVSVSVGKKFGAEVEWTDGKVSIRLTAFRCRIEEGDVTALEHEEIRWCDKDGLAGLDWAEADKPIVAEFIG